MNSLCHPFDVRLAQAKLVSAHCVISFMCVVTKNGISLRLSLLPVILPTCCQYRSRRERIFTVLWILVQCLLYSPHVRFTQKEQNNDHKVVAERWLLQEEEEDLDDFPTENFNKQADSMVGTFRAESTDQLTSASGITAKNPPL